jgi:hypothetical protein
MIRPDGVDSNHDVGACMRVVAVSKCSVLPERTAARVKRKEVPSKKSK